MKSYNRGLTRPEINNIFFLEIRIPPADTFQMTITMVEMVHYMHNQILKACLFSIIKQIFYGPDFWPTYIFCWPTYIVIWPTYIPGSFYPVHSSLFQKVNQSYFYQSPFSFYKNFEPIIAHKSFLLSLCAPFLLQ